MIRADMIEILENKKEGRKKLKAKNQLKIARERISWKQIAIKTTHTYYRQEFFCFKVNFDDILDQGQNWALYLLTILKL